MNSVREVWRGTTARTHYSVQRMPHVLLGGESVWPASITTLTANHVNHNENDNANIAEHECRELTTMIFGALGEWFELTTSHRYFAIHFGCTINVSGSSRPCTCTESTSLRIDTISRHVAVVVASVAATKSIRLQYALHWQVSFSWTASINLFIDDNKTTE